MSRSTVCHHFSLVEEGMKICVSLAQAFMPGSEFSLAQAFMPGSEMMHLKFHPPPLGAKYLVAAPKGATKNPRAPFHPRRKRLG
jgi:hypothetical protein